MPTNTSAAILQLIAAAVTPVVMVSACAALLLGLNNKHSGLTTLVRHLTAEYRAQATIGERRARIERQVAMLRLRCRLIGISLGTLYSAVACFTVTVLILTSTTREGTWDLPAVIAFVAGVVLILISVIAELLESYHSHRTLDIEISDIVTKGNAA